MKVIYFAQEAWEEQYMRERLAGIELGFVVGSIQANPTVGDTDAEALCVFVSSHVGAVEMDRFPKLKLIATRSTGFDHIDLDEARKRNITVTTVPSYGVNTVAEFAFALLLALVRKLCIAFRRVHEDSSFSQEGLTGMDLAGKTMGLVGCGRIGVHAAKIAKGFAMKVLVFDARHDLALANEVGFEYVSLEALLAQSDVISLHVPYNEHTHHLINMGNIGLIKKGAYLINTARGAVVETAAIVKGLQDGILAGVGLDVLEDENNMAKENQVVLESGTAPEEVRTALANHYLMTHPCVIVTPHVAFDTNEAIRRILDTTAGNIASFTNGAPVNTVA